MRRALEPDPSRDRHRGDDRDRRQKRAHQARFIEPRGPAPRPVGQKPAGALLQARCARPRCARILGERDLEVGATRQGAFARSDLSEPGRARLRGAELSLRGRRRPGRTAARSRRATRSCRAATSRSSRARRCRRARQRPTPASARRTYSMRCASSSVPMPFSVTWIGTPRVLRGVADRSPRAPRARTRSPSIEHRHAVLAGRDRRPGAAAHAGCRSARRRSRRSRAASRKRVVELIVARFGRGVASPPGTAWSSCIASVTPTGKSPRRAAFMHHAPARCAASSTSRVRAASREEERAESARERRRSAAPPRRRPAPAHFEPVAAQPQGMAHEAISVLASLMVQAMPIRSPRCARRALAEAQRSGRRCAIVRHAAVGGEPARRGEVVVASRTGRTPCSWQAASMRR